VNRLQGGLIHQSDAENDGFSLGDRNAGGRQQVSFQNHLLTGSGRAQMTRRGSVISQHEWLMIQYFNRRAPPIGRLPTVPVCVCSFYAVSQETFVFCLQHMYGRVVPCLKSTTFVSCGIGHRLMLSLERRPIRCAALKCGRRWRVSLGALAPCGPWQTSRGATQQFHRPSEREFLSTLSLHLQIAPIAYRYDLSLRMCGSPL